MPHIVRHERLEPRRLPSAVVIDGLDKFSEYSSTFSLGTSIVVANTDANPLTVRQVAYDGSSDVTHPWPFDDAVISFHYVASLKGRALLTCIEHNGEHGSLWLSGGETSNTKKLFDFGDETNVYQTVPSVQIGDRVVVAVSNKLVVTDGSTGGTKALSIDTRGLHLDRITALEAVGDTFRFNVSAIDGYLDGDFGDNYYNQLFSGDPVTRSVEFLEQTPSPYDHDVSPKTLSSNSHGTFFLTAGTYSDSQLVYDTGRKKTRSTISDDPVSDQFMTFGDGVLFFKRESSDAILSYYNGAKIASLKAFDASFSQMTRVGTRVLFVVESGDRHAVWSTDGTKTGTFELNLLPMPAADASSYYQIEAHGDDVYIAGSAAEDQTGVFVTDGTADGTHQIESWLTPESIVVQGSNAFISGEFGQSTARHVFRLDEDNAQIVGQITYKPEGTRLFSLDGIKVFIDEDRDGRFDRDERSTTTADDGHFSFSDLSGKVRVAVDTMDGKLEVRGSSVQSVSLEDGETTEVGFRVTSDRRTAKVSGTVYQYDEPSSSFSTLSTAPIAGAHAYVDLNHDGRHQDSEPDALSDAAGKYEIVGVPRDQSSEVRVVESSKMHVFGTAETIVFVPGRTHVAAAIVLTPVATIRGRVYDDRNGNGSQDAGEPNLPGARIDYYPAVTAGASTTGKVYADDDGMYSLRVAKVQSFIDVSANAKGYQATERKDSFNIESGGVATSNLGMTRLARLTIALVADDDGKAKTRENQADLGGAAAWADLNGNDVKDSGEAATIYENRLTFSTIPPKRTVKIHVAYPAGYRSFDGDVLSVTLTSGATESRTLLAWKPAQVIGSVFNDTDRDGGHDPAEATLAGVRVYADLNANGKRDANDPWGFTRADGEFMLDSMPVGNYELHASPPAGYRARDEAFVAKVRSGMTNHTDVGITNRSAVIVSAYVDQNGNGRFDRGEGDDFDNYRWTVNIPRLAESTFYVGEGYDNDGFGGYFDGGYLPSNSLPLDNVPAGNYDVRIEHRTDNGVTKVRRVAITVSAASVQHVRVRLPGDWL